MGLLRTWAMQRALDKIAVPGAREVLAIVVGYGPLPTTEVVDIATDLMGPDTIDTKTADNAGRVLARFGLCTYDGEWHATSSGHQLARYNGTGR